MRRQRNAAAARSIRRMNRGDTPVSADQKPAGDEKTNPKTGAVTKEIPAQAPPTSAEVERDRQKLFPENFGEKKDESK